MNIFEEYDKAWSEACRLRNKINSLVVNYIDKKVGIVTEEDSGDPNVIGKTMKSEISWSYLGNDEIQIAYSPIADRYIDYWDDDVYIIIECNELLNIN